MRGTGVIGSGGYRNEPDSQPAGRPPGWPAACPPSRYVRRTPVPFIPSSRQLQEPAGPVSARSFLFLLEDLNPLCDIMSGYCFFTGPWTVTCSSLRMLCRPLRPVLLLVSFPRSRSPVVGVPGLCWMWQDVPFARQRRPVVGVLVLVAGVV